MKAELKHNNALTPSSYWPTPALFNSSLRIKAASFCTQRGKKSVCPHPALFTSSNQLTATRTQTQASDRKRGRRRRTDENTHDLPWHCVGCVGGALEMGGETQLRVRQIPHVMSAPTHSPDVSIHSARHSHTPPRDGASSVGLRLNYSSSSIPVPPPPTPHLHHSRLRRKGQAADKGILALTHSRQHEKQQLRQGKGVWGGHAYQMCRLMS